MSSSCNFAWKAVSRQTPHVMVGTGAAPPLVRTLIEGRIAGYLSRVSYVAARLDMNSCAANVRSVLRVKEGASLIPKNWMLNEDSPTPAFGDLLPRDTVLMVRLGIQVERISSILLQIGRLGSGLGGLGSVLGFGDQGKDPIATLLGKHVHSDLADRHIVRDLANHLTGHVAVAVTGMDSRATLTARVVPFLVTELANRFLVKSARLLTMEQ